MDNLVKRLGAKTLKEDIYSTYENYCKDHEFEKEEINSFWRRMKEIIEYKEIDGGKEDRRRRILGYALVTDAAESEEVQPAEVAPKQGYQKSDKCTDGLDRFIKEEPEEVEEEAEDVEEEEEPEPEPQPRARRNRRARTIFRGSIPHILEELWEYKYNGIYYIDPAYYEYKTTNNSFSIKWENNQYNIYSYERLIGAVDNRGNMALICLINKLDEYRGEYVSMTTSCHISKVYNFFRYKLRVKVVQNYDQVEEDLKYNLHLIAF
jgi:hypothetical protein